MTADHDSAVMMACDSNYLPFALHLAWQIHVWNPERQFDILIVTFAETTLPDWAVRDVMHFYAPYNPQAREFRDRGMPAHPYFNSGVILFDTAAYRAQDLNRRFLDRSAEEGDRVWLYDQTLMNLVLAGRFAELWPVWNWVCTAFLPWVTHRYPVRFRHFIGAPKPWRDSRGTLDARFAAGYAAFFRNFRPKHCPGSRNPAVPRWAFARSGAGRSTFSSRRERWNRSCHDSRMNGMPCSSRLLLRAAS